MKWKIYTKIQTTKLIQEKIENLCGSIINKKNELVIRTFSARKIANPAVFTGGFYQT